MNICGKFYRIDIIKITEYENVPLPPSLESSSIHKYATNSGLSWSPLKIVLVADVFNLF